MYFLFFCLLIAVGGTKDGWANATDVKLAEV
nr:MAG TPA: hypothetical protein [Caudoviricetes sp.]